MYELKGSVGKGGANNPADVAFVQFALKVISKKNSSGTYYSGKINGDYTDSFDSSLLDFREDYGDQIRVLIMQDRLTNTNYLQTIIPAKYQKYNFHIFKSNGSILFFLTLKNTSSVSSSAKANFTLPKKENEALVAIQKRVLSRAGVLLDIEKISALSDGRFYVDFILKGGTFLNLENLTVTTKQTKLSDTIGAFLLSEGYVGADQWEVYDSKNYVLRSKTVFPYLQIDKRLKTYVIRSLGVKNSQFPEGLDVVNHCYAALELAYIYKDLPPEKEKFLLECLGKDQETVLASRSARITRCYVRVKELDDIRTNIRDVLTDYSTAMGQVSAILFELGRISEKQLLATTLALSSFGGGRLAGQAVKGAAKSNIADYTVSQGVSRGADYFDVKNRTDSDGNSADGLFANRFSNDDAVDITLKALGGAAFLVGFVFTAGVAATLLVVGGVLLALAEWAKDMFDISKDQEELHAKLKSLRSDLLALEEQRAYYQDALKKILEIMDNEGCFFSPSDYEFLEEADEAGVYIDLKKFYERLEAA